MKDERLSRHPIIRVWLVPLAPFLKTGNILFLTFAFENLDDQGKFSGKLTSLDKLTKITQAGHSIQCQNLAPLPTLFIWLSTSKIVLVEQSEIKSFHWVVTEYPKSL